MGHIEKAAAITARYTKAAADRPAGVQVSDWLFNPLELINVKPAPEELVDNYRIGTGK